MELQTLTAQLTNQFDSDQIGRGVLQHIGTKLLAQFALQGGICLDRHIALLKHLCAEQGAADAINQASETLAYLNGVDQAFKAVS